METGSLFVLPVYGILGKGVLVVLTNYSQLTATQLKETLSQVRCLVNGRIAIAFARLYSRMIRGSCIPSPLRDR